MSKQVRCNSCRAWFDAFYHECPECDYPRPAFNSWLNQTKFNNALLEQKRRAIENA